MEDKPVDRDAQEDVIEIIDIPDISDIPGSRRRSNPAVFMRRNKRHINLFGMVSTFFLVLVLLNAASGSRFTKYIGNLWPHPTKSTPVVTSQGADVMVSSQVIMRIGFDAVYAIQNGQPALAPNDCSQVDQVDTKQTIGAPPLWISGFTGPRAVAHLQVLSTLPVQSNPPETLSLWGTRLRVVMQPGFKLPINLSFVSERNSKTPSIGFWLDEQHPVTKNKNLYNLSLVISEHVMLDPLNPSQVTEGVLYKGGNTWEIQVYLFEAGCFSMKADWGSGLLQAYFAAGR